MLLLSIDDKSNNATLLDSDSGIVYIIANGSYVQAYSAHCSNSTPVIITNNEDGILLIKQLIWGVGMKSLSRERLLAFLLKHLSPDLAELLSSR